MIVPLALVLSLASHGPSPKPQAIELFGEVKEVSGGAGGSRALLLVEGGEYQLHGGADPSENELKRLAGAKVRIYGMTGDPRIPRGKHVLVERYEIVDVGGGVAPRMGHIAKLELEGGTRLLFVDAAGNAELLPQGWGKKMMQHVGAKIWLVGSRDKKELKPERFAILKSTEGENR
jgi:hypothetical protein